MGFKGFLFYREIRVFRMIFSPPHKILKKLEILHEKHEFHDLEKKLVVFMLKTF